MNVLVTGGAGYIGSHAAMRLLEAGHRVVVVDDLSRGRRGAIEALKQVGPVEFVDRLRELGFNALPLAGWRQRTLF